MKKRKEYWIASTLVSIFIIVWSYVVAKTTVDMRISQEHSNLAVLEYFLHNPRHFFKLIFDTVSDLDYLSGYAEEIVIYKNFPLRTLYAPFLILVLICGVLSTSFKKIDEDVWSRVVLVITSLFCIFLVFSFLLITWSGVNFERIEGVMGRYFVVPIIMLGFALSGYQECNVMKHRKYAVLILILMASISMVYLSTACFFGKNYKLYPEQSVYIEHEQSQMYKG